MQLWSSSVNTRYVINFANPYTFKGQPQTPINNSQVDWNRIIMIKLKDLFQGSGTLKSKLQIENQL